MSESNESTNNNYYYDVVELAESDAPELIRAIANQLRHKQYTTTGFMLKQATDDELDHIIVKLNAHFKGEQVNIVDEIVLIRLLAQAEQSLFDFESVSESIQILHNLFNLCMIESLYRENQCDYDARQVSIFSVQMFETPANFLEIH